jgi:hypothetical protein
MHQAVHLNYIGGEWSARSTAAVTVDDARRASTVIGR